GTPRRGRTALDRRRAVDHDRVCRKCARRRRRQPARGAARQPRDLVRADRRPAPAAQSLALGPRHPRDGRRLGGRADDRHRRAARREDILNFLFLVLLSIALAQSWNVIAGYAGQVNLGHAAFFGLGALVTRVLWIAGTPVVIGMIAGALVAVAFALLIGWAAFR